MIQPDSQRALDELGFTYYGAYAVLSPGVNIVEKAIPNLATSVQPALQDISQQLAMNTDTVSTYGSQQGSPYRNQMQVVADMDVSTRLSGASLNLFAKLGCPSDVCCSVVVPRQSAESLALLNIISAHKFSDPEGTSVQNFSHPEGTPRSNLLGCAIVNLRSFHCKFWQASMWIVRVRDALRAAL